MAWESIRREGLNGPMRHGWAGSARPRPDTLTTQCVRVFPQSGRQAGIPRRTTPSDTIKTRRVMRHVPPSRRTMEPTRRPEDTGGASNGDHALSLVSHGGLAVVGPKAGGWSGNNPSGCMSQAPIGGMMSQ
ncbi:hypothetical protein GE21DRAFT_1197696 [Neurospora crassa]|nr:hypothetical protein GE21DRAFT_1197696 [Neurospora crassa]